MSTHEDISRRERIEPPSDRSFAIVWTIFFLIVGLWLLWKGLNSYLWVLGIAGLLALSAWLWPTLLHVPNRLWFAFSMLLARVVTPIMAGVMFFGLFTPLAAIMRVVGRDPLQLRWDSDAESYWISRTQTDSPPETMTNQF